MNFSTVYILLAFCILSCKPTVFVRKNRHIVESEKVIKDSTKSVLVFEPSESELFIFPSPEIATIKIIDNGFTTKGCDYQSIVNTAISQTLSLGGNCLRIDWHSEPTLLSECHQIGARIYKLENIEGLNVGKIYGQNGYTYAIPPSKWNEEENDSNLKDFYFGFGVGVQAIQTDYKLYSPYIGTINTEILNQNNALGVFLFDFGYKKSIFGVGFGFANSQNSDRLDKYKQNDSVSRNVSAHLFELSYAYKLLYSKYFDFFPTLSFKYFRERLRTSQSDSKISLDQLNTKNDLDLRFNYFLAFLGSEIAFKFYPLKQLGFSIGSTLGYLLPLNSRPFMYSHSNQLSNNPSVKINNLFFTFNLGLIIR